MKRALFLLPLIAAMGCAKTPDRIESPRANFRVVIEQDRPNFVMTLIGGIRNENSDVAFIDFEGEIIFKGDGSALKKSPAGRLSFKIERIFPFETARISVEVRGGEADFRPVFDLLEIDQDEVIKSGGTDEVYIPDDAVELRVRSYRTAGIDTLLKGK